jgi:hypothetical protein
MKNNSKISVITASLLIFFGIVSRFLLVNVPNVSGLETLALFGGSYFLLKRFAFIIPIAAYMLSDFIINNTVYSAYYSDGVVFYQNYMLWTIGSLFLIVILGKFLLQRVNLKNTVFGVLGATTIFWLVSNFGDWLGSAVYAKSFSGLIACYIAAIPFYAYSLIGNAAFGLILFGGYELVKSNAPEYALSTSKIK